MHLDHDVPPPAGALLPAEEAEKAVAHALAEAEEKGIRGRELTPYVLARVGELSAGASLRANLALLENNARVGAAIAGAWYGRR